MSKLTLARFVEVADGALLDGTTATHTAEALPFRPNADSRTLRRGETFVALRGPNFDGHDFITAAIAGGAVALVVDEISAIPVACTLPVAVVADARTAYLRGAAAARRLARHTIVVAVTGSNGKTTTKTFAAQLIGRFRRTIATPMNENNELGVAKLCYALDDSVDVAIAEFGARHPGEIADLVEMAMPDVGVLVNIAEAHLEFFSGIEELARTKFAIFGSGARAVFNAGDEWTRRLADEAGLGERALWVRLCAEPEAPGLTLEAGVPQKGQVALSLGASHAFAPWHMLGEHHLRDALLAAGAALQCGLGFEEVIAGFGDLRLPPGRFELHALPGDVSVVYDAYNASPTSTRHALDAFVKVPAARRIAVLGSMAELGVDTRAKHQEVGAYAARVGIDALYCGGEHAQVLARAALDAGMPQTAVHTFVTNAEVAETLRAQARSGDAILLKGSRVQRMEEILDRLLAPREIASAPSVHDVGAGVAAVPAAASSAAWTRATRNRTVASSFAVGHGVIALPVRTPIVRPGDDLARLVADCVRGIAGSDDVVCVSETAVAIAQGRSIAAEAIRPSRLARLLADQAGSYATMSQPESVQLVIESAGTARVLAAAAAGAMGRLIGRRGDFYRLLGSAVAEIDGYTGTMPPFERHIVLGPREPQGVAEQIAHACGAHAAIVDANDLAKVEILGASAAVDREAVRAVLRGNPHGNSDQQTPVVVLKYRRPQHATAASPLLRAC